MEDDDLDDMPRPVGLGDLEDTLGDVYGTLESINGTLRDIKRQLPSFGSIAFQIGGIVFGAVFGVLIAWKGIPALERLYRESGSEAQQMEECIADYKEAFGVQPPNEGCKQIIASGKLQRDARKQLQRQRDFYEKYGDREMVKQLEAQLK